MKIDKLAPLRTTLRDSEHGIQLWFTAGTAASTVRLTDVGATEAAGIQLLGEVSGRGFFALGGALWRTDGAPTGTEPWFAVVRERSPGGPRRLFDAGELLYFVAIPEAFQDQAGCTDGTEAGTRFLAGPLQARNTHFSHLDDVSEPTIAFYTTSWCGWCRKSRALLDELGARYHERDVEQDAAAAVEKDAIAPESGVPVIAFGETVLTGYTERGIRNLVEQWRAAEKTAEAEREASRRPAPRGAAPH